MDDTPDKLRRNVVALAAAILAIAFFHLSFKTTGTLLGFAEVGNISAFKVWLALAVILAYVVVRYHHADETAREREFVVEQFRELRRVAITGRVEAAIRKYFLQGLPVTLFDNPDEFTDRDIAVRMEQDGRATEVDDLRVGTAEQGTGVPWWRGRVGVSFHANWPSMGGYGRSGGTLFAFTLSYRYRLHVTALALLRSATHSRAGVDVALPYSLASLAALTCFYNMAYFAVV
jgi:hypothetical protein